LYHGLKNRKLNSDSSTGSSLWFIYVSKFNWRQSKMVRPSGLTILINICFFWFWKPTICKSGFTYGFNWKTTHLIHGMHS
jgi:hypothetical protein